MKAGEDDPYGGDPVLRDCVERALAPHSGHLPAEQIEAMREVLILFVTTHPAAEPLYARLRSRPHVERSTLVERRREREISGVEPAAGSGPRKVRGA